LRTAFSVVAQWLRGAWRLPWSLKGPLLGVLGVLVVLLAVLPVVITVGGGGSDDAAKEAFAGFLTDRNLTANQIEFVNLIIELKLFCGNQLQELKTFPVR